MSNAIELASTWSDIDTVLSRWLKERQELITKLCSIYGLKKYSMQDLPIERRVQQLCQILIDYTSVAHFEIYDKLVQEAELFEDDYKQIFSCAVLIIQKTTQQIVSFNDKYETSIHCKRLKSNLPNDLSSLAESLETRFQAEDKLISLFHAKHKKQLNPVN